MCITHCINMFPRQDPKKKHFWARKGGHFCQIWLWQLLNFLHTSQFISEVMLEFWQQLPFLVNMERGLIQLLHTYCIGHLETWGVAIPPIHRFSNNLLSYLRRWLFCLWMIKMIWTCRKNEGGGGSNWWGEVPGVLIRAGHYDDSHCIFWQIQWSYPIRQSIDNVGVEKTSPRLPPRPMKGPRCAALASTTGISIRIWIPM